MYIICRNSPQQLHSVDTVRDRTALDSHESNTASNSASRLEGSDDHGSELETASQTKERLELMDVSLNFDQLPEDIVHQKWQDLMERNLSSSVVDDSTLESGDDESSYDTSEDPSSPSEDEEHSSLSWVCLGTHVCHLDGLCCHSNRLHALISICTYMQNV